MAVHTHNKLVRDRIPDIIRQSGKTCHTVILDDEAYARCLRDKLQEETQEFLDSRDVEELADIMEVVYALAAHKGYSVQQLEELRARKTAERGGFADRVFLTLVND